VSVSLGPWLFIAQRCLITSSQAERELDPLSFKLLSFFIENSTRIISRQELVEEVWKQSFVDDNAINRAMSELRKQLSHPDLKSGMIKTHYRKGYSLTVSVEQTQQQSNEALSQTDDGAIHQQETIDNENNNNLNVQSPVESIQVENVNNEGLLKKEAHQVNRKKQSILSPTTLLWLAVSLIIVLCGITGYSLWNDYSFQSSAEQRKEPYVDNASKASQKHYTYSVTSATWNHGGESNPLVSPQQQFFAYSNINEGVVKTHVKRLSDQVEVVLDVPGMEIGGLSWQQGHQKLLTLLVNLERKECHYVLFDITTFPNIAAPTKIKSCNTLNNGYAQLDKETENLFYTQVDEGFSGAAIYQYDLINQREKVLVAPSNNRYGSIQVKLSPDGKYLAYLWSQIKSPLKVYIMNLATRETSLLHEFSKERLHYALSWFDDSRHILTSESDELLKIHIDSKSVERIKLPQELAPFYLAIEFENQVLLSQRDSQRYQLVKGSGLFTDNPPSFTNVHESETSDFYPEASNINNELHYFVSKRTGTNQIWQSKGDKLKQLTYLDDSGAQRINGLALSPDNKSLLFLQGASLWLIDLTSEKVHQISELTNINLIDFKWGSKAHIIYFINVEGQNNKLNKFNLMTRQISLIETGEVSHLYGDGTGNVYYRANKYLINVASKHKTLINIPNKGLIFADVSEKYFYSTDALSSIYRMNLETGKVQHIEIPFRQRDLSVVDDESLIFTKRKYKNTSIKRVSWN